ncbi:amidophosphoribosyltransferase-like [Octopus sinensis]|uniref:Amidophosphoribosyltransferase n=1 Tax=Octopus sinensis TaxID=2607531 RepID=A0A6P7SWI8_9MOLL|nr:amidophosphoribosyltransferase-like [Octopus sinensis]XP_036363193.1 amidophosphoribosyltransferase-like [Octopus sinensis]
MCTNEEFFIPDDESGLEEACGVFGCVASGEWPQPPKTTDLDVPHIICLGLVGLQHRGQESAGIVTSTGNEIHFTQKKGMGLVSHIFREEEISQLRGNLGIGHTRYSTAGSSNIINCQPFVVDTLHGKIGVAHNGELVNAKSLRKKLLRHGVGLSTSTDSELITQVLTHTPQEGEPNGCNWITRIKNLMKITSISYSLLIMHKSKIYAVRDPFGNRPLCIGQLQSINTTDEEVYKQIDGWLVSSESCSFQAVGAKYIREVLPGEIVEISQSGVKSLCRVPCPGNKPSAFCIFEYVYFARPDSIMEGQMVYSVRKRCGQQLAIEFPVNVDLVSTVPESATPAAMAYAEMLGIPYGEVLCKNRYVGRTFIQPSLRLRQLGVAKKFGALTENFKGKRIVLIDDSIVRGTTMAPIIKLLKTSGATEVHIRVASPPVKYPCYMGINIPTKEELIANQFNSSQLAEHLGADSLEYLSVEGLHLAVKKGAKHMEDDGKNGYCAACLTGNYPAELDW